MFAQLMQEPDPDVRQSPGVQRLFDFYLPTFPGDEPGRRVLSRCALAV